MTTSDLDVNSPHLITCLNYAAENENGNPSLRARRSLYVITACTIFLTLWNWNGFDRRGVPLDRHGRDCDATILHAAAAVLAAALVVCVVMLLLVGHFGGRTAHLYKVAQLNCYSQLNC